MPLKPGDTAPEWTMLAALDHGVGELSLAPLLAPHTALVLTTYPLDFTGG